ncbi:DUF814 domain-containing protein [candidate division WOR-3 bacterium]|nr:DUF814 domain-containing protein [candidate division WOR-3 bacterium]
MNGIFLHFLLAELRSQLIGALVESIEARGRIVQLILDGRSLVISLYPDCLGMFLTSTVERGYEPVRAISGIVKSSRIIGVVQEHLMPVVRMHLEKPFPGKEILQVIISFYTDAPNFSVRTVTMQRNLFTRYVEKKPKSSILDLDEDQLAAAGVDFIVKNVEGVDRSLAHELNIDYIKKIKSALRGHGVHPRLVSAVPLRISLVAAKGGEAYPTFNELLRTAVHRYEKEREKKRREHDRDARARNIKRQIARLQRKLLSPAEVESHRVAGELILSNLGQISKGVSNAEFFDPRTRERREIALDPALTPQANAQKYFARYKKAKRGQPKLRERIVVLERELTALKLEPEAEPASRPNIKRERPASEPFHKFTLDSGSVVFVGKNARSNDALTFRDARPADYFFHARGVEGAHTILRSSVPRGQRPPRDEIRAAAAIAAYFSKARKQRNVPVSYTQRKFLKKAKKGKPGAVILMREEVVFVDPGLPY